MIGIANSSSDSEALALQSYSLRWVVLAAWHRDLKSRGVALDSSLIRKLDRTRVKIATGTFSSCEVGCELGQIEADLVSLHASLAPHEVDDWLFSLEKAMTEPHVIKRQPWFQAIQVQWLDCGYHACRCPA